MDKTWGIKDADRYFYGLGVKRATKGLPFVDEKNPARAFSFSLFFWGAGQSYAGLRMKSVLYQIFMFIFLIGIVFFIVFGKELFLMFQAEGVSHAEALLTAEALLFVVLVFWMYNAIDAYHAAARARRVPFRGVENRTFPMISSFLIPGWGQFLNGQPVKGGLLAIFSVLSIFSLVTIPAVLVFWPSLEAGHARAIVETVFTVTVLYAPLIPFISLFGSYDALIVSLYDSKKESLLDRIVLALNRIHDEGLVRMIFPLFKTSVVAALLLSFVAVAINRNYFPANYVYRQLADVQSSLQNQGMTVVPNLINKLLSGKLV